MNRIKYINFQEPNYINNGLTHWTSYMAIAHP